MPKYRVTSPDGAVYEVNAPDGATEADAIAYVQRQATAAPKQPAPVPNVAAEEAGPVDAAIIGAGRTFDRMAQGLKDMALSVPASLGHQGARDERAKMAAREAENTRLYAQLQERRPVATFLGEAAPLLAVPVAAGGGMAAAGAAAALPGLIEYGTPEERLARGAFGAVGGMAGAALGKGIGRVLQPTRGAPNEGIQAGIDAAERLGYKVTAGQQTGSRALQTLEQQAAKNPIGAAVGARSFVEGNQAALNRAAMKAMGESGDAVTEEAMAAARSRLGGIFDALSSNKTIPITARFEAQVNALKQKTELAGPFKSAEISGLVDDALELAKTGQMTGEAYQAIRSQLTDYSRQAAQAGKAKLQSSIGKVRNALDEAAESVLTADERALWNQARKQYSAMKTLEKRGAIKGGNVDPAIIRNLLQSGDRAAFARGGLSGELSDIARIGNAFRPLPDSGTATNTVAQLLLTGGAGLAGPGTLAAALAGPALVSKGLFSDAGRRYLTKGLVDVSPELERRLMMGGAGLLGLPAIAGAGR